MKMETKKLTVKWDKEGSDIVFRVSNFPDDYKAEAAFVNTVFNACFAFNNNKVNPAENVKSPLGITPQYIADEKRFDEVLNGISRYNSAHIPIPISWLIEIQELYYRAQSRRDREENVSPNLIIRNHSTGND